MSDRKKVEQYLAVLFRENEATCYAKHPNGTSIFAVNQPPNWVQFLSINPLDPEHDRNPYEEFHDPDRPRRADDNATAYRNILLECDGMPLDDQLPYMEELGIPVSTCVFSGSKSYHFIVALETGFPDKASYDYHVEWLHNIATEVDHKTKNVSRLSRFPEVNRIQTGLRQSLEFVRGRVKDDDFLAFLHRHPDAIPKESIVDMAAVLPEGEKGFLSKKTRDFFTHGADSGDWNSRLYLAARDMLQNGWSENEATPVLMLGLEQHPDYRRNLPEYLTTIHSAFRKAPKFPPRMPDGFKPIS